MGGYRQNTTPWWDFPRGMGVARILVQVGMEHGMTLAACLAGTGLTPNDLHDQGTVIEAAQQLVLVRNLLAHLGDRPGLGVQVGLRFTVSDAGIVGFAILSSPTVRDAITVALRYTALSYSFLRFALEEDGDQARLVFDDGELPADLRAFLLESELAALAVNLPVFLGHVPEVRLELCLDPVRGRALTEMMPVTSVEFHRPSNALVFPRGLLDAPLPQADEHTARLCERQCQELLERRRGRQGLAGQVRARLLRDPGDLPSLEILAQELHLDPRTLRRHLTQEGTSFRALVDEVRETLAVELLTHVGLSVEEVAQRLGYAETASFTHAFKRWRAVPPSQYRRARARSPHGEISGLA